MSINFREFEPCAARYQGHSGWNGAPPAATGLRPVERTILHYRAAVCRPPAATGLRPVERMILHYAPPSAAHPPPPGSALYALEYAGRF